MNPISRIALRLLLLLPISQISLIGQPVIPIVEPEFQIFPYRCLLEFPESLPMGHWFGLYFKEARPGEYPTSANLKAVNIKVAPCKSDAFGILSGPKIIGGTERDLKWVIRGLSTNSNTNRKVPTVQPKPISTPIALDQSKSNPFLKDWLFGGSPISLSFITQGKDQYSVVLSFKGKNQDLGHFGSNEGSWQPIFLGDLDGDGLPDLIISISEHYAAGHWYLFLSSKAAEGKLVAEVASFFDPGD
jgi:hypothetical protein